MDWGRGSEDYFSRLIHLESATDGYGDTIMESSRVELDF